MTLNQNEYSLFTEITFHRNDFSSVRLSGTGVGARARVDEPPQVRILVDRANSSAVLGVGDQFLPGRVALEIPTLSFSLAAKFNRKVLI